MRHLILCGSLVFAMNACSKGMTVQEAPSITTSKDVSRAVVRQDWKLVIQLAQGTKDPLTQLVRDYALFRAERFEEVLRSPQIKSELFEPYQNYLRWLASKETRAFTYARLGKIPENLPRRMIHRTLLIKADFLKQMGLLNESRQLLLQVLDRINGSALTGDVLLLLADVEWDLNLKSEALKRYRTLYETYPLADSEDQAASRLTEAGNFQTIETETHVQRIQRLQRAAQFRRAGKELTKLLKSQSGADRNRLQLAEAQLAFSMREYSRSLQISKKFTMDSALTNLDPEWHNLMAWSLIRLGKAEDGRSEYEKLLKKKVSKPLKETILYRLGASALDDQQFELALKYFGDLRNEFPRGRFQESAHWFEAWALYQSAIRENPLNESKLKSAAQLLQKLPQLPDGENLSAQSLYWQQRVWETLRTNDKAAALKSELLSKMGLSFYSQIQTPKPFHFLGEFEIRGSAPTTISDVDVDSFDNKTSWRRLEAFREVHLMDWARLELDLFLEATKTRSRDVKFAVAQRLRAIEDWPDLVRWSELYIGKPLQLSDETRETLEILYPRAHEKAVAAASREFRVSPFLIWGLMREESRFESDARSRAGAEGLMQLMPSLSKRIGRSIGENRSYSGWMFEPPRNIRFGTYHLKELESQVRDFPVVPELRPVLMIASYNAGIDAVRKWVKEQDTSRLDTFVESIPYTETRGYVKRVLQSANIYYQLYGPHQKRVAAERGVSIASKETR